MNPTKTPPGVEQADAYIIAGLAELVNPTKTPPGVEQDLAVITPDPNQPREPDQDAPGR